MNLAAHFVEPQFERHTGLETCRPTQGGNSPRA
jgi:hypothetical protein